MKRVAILLLLFSNVVARAELEWKSREIFLRGEPADKSFTAAFEAKNTGSAPVRITRVKKMCSCTAAKPEREIIAPGATAKIDVRFDIGDRRGLYATPITVYTDDPTQRQTVLTLKMLIEDAAELKPRLLFWRRDEDPQPRHATLTLHNGRTAASVNAGTLEGASVEISRRADGRLPARRLHDGEP